MHILKVQKNFMPANVEIKKGAVAHTVVVCVSERAMNRLAQIQEILSNMTCAFITISYQLLFRNCGESPFWFQCYSYTLSHYHILTPWSSSNVEHSNIKVMWDKRNAAQCQAL